MPSFEEIMRGELEIMRENLRHVEVMRDKAGKDTYFGNYLEGQADATRAAIFMIETYLAAYGGGERG